MGFVSPQSLSLKNGAAIALFEEFGFSDEGRNIKEIKLGTGDYVDEVLMCKWIGA